jgi:Alternative complex III, ActD subunit
MIDRRMIGVFESEDDIMHAVRTFRSRGYSIEDVYTPYAIHGLERALGMKRSRLPWITLLLGLTGAGLKVWFEYWTTAVSWPVNVGGKPWDSLPAFVPVTFEVMVLLAGVSTVLVFLGIAKLYPGKKPKRFYPGVTDDRFVLILNETDAAFDPEYVEDLFYSLNAVDVDERIGEEGR